MATIKEQIPRVSGSTVQNQLKLWRLTALWGFSEAAFGGILHALKVPFSGILISGAAVIFITLIAYYSQKKDEILKACLTVMLIKAAVSPHTPVTAYFAVFTQGLLGYILFYNKRFFKTSALLLGICAGLLSAIQKLIVLTLVFGNTLWKSTDIFLNYIISQFTQDPITGIKYSYLLAGIYLSIHLAGGFTFGILAGKIPFSVQSRKIEAEIDLKNFNEDLFSFKKKKRTWWKRPTGIIIISISILTVIYSYLIPISENSLASEVLIMIIRSIVIMFLWYSFLSPYALKLLNKYLTKKNAGYSKEIASMINLFPRFRYLISYAWQNTQSFNGIFRLKKFLILSFIYLLNDENISPEWENRNREDYQADKLGQRK